MMQRNDCEEQQKEMASSEHGSSEASGEQELADTAEKQVDEVIAKQETKVVWYLRLVVALVLVSAALGVALTTFFHISGSERQVFENKFNDDSQKLFDAIGASIDRTMGTFDSLSVTLISFARATNAEWPYVTLPDFAIRMSKILPFSNMLGISVSPVVSPEQRSAWEAYSVTHDYWVNETLVVQQNWDNFYGSVNFGWEPYGTIHGDFDDVPINVTRPLLPQWQNFPTVSSAYAPYNYDSLSVSYAESLLSCMNNHLAVISEAYMIPAPDDPVAQAETDAWEDWFRDYLPPTEDPREPISEIYYPVIDDLSQVELAHDGDEEQHDHAIVAVLATSLYWREMLRNILPDDSHGIDIVFKNPCTVAFTYRIHGPNTTYLGVDDQHDTRYDHLVRVKNLTDHGKSSSKVYTGVPLDGNYCPFTLYAYPSRLMESNHTSNHRVLFTVAAVMIFAFTSLIFCLYDVTVERRQKVVMHTAVRSTAIVSSLFPEDVCDRLYDAGQQKQEESHAKSNMLSFVSTRTVGPNSEGRKDLFASDPIAELYPDTTVLFADIAGFTAWSAHRQPTQVFRLLESLYHAFDEVAKQRGVFKVETIGDSYVAVVGLPAPRDQHALVMARFARDIRAKMAEVTLDLETSLGEGTADLALRIGLNSGPTTAGVLRGEKSRFQLFGDTVNTAARMESNGERSKIHVSQSTADLIVASGKRHWLTARAEMVNAKGKGLMQTYFCEPIAGTGSTSHAESSCTDDENGCSVGDATDGRYESIEI